MGAHRKALPASTDLAGRVHEICLRFGDPYDVEQSVLDKVHELVLRNGNILNELPTDTLIFRARRWTSVDLNRARSRQRRMLEDFRQYSGHEDLYAGASYHERAVLRDDLDAIGLAACEVLDGLKNQRVSDALVLELILSPRGQRTLLGRFDDVILEVTELSEKQRLNALNGIGIFNESPWSETGKEKRKRYTESVDQILARWNVSPDEVLEMLGNRELLSRSKPMVIRIAQTIVRLLQCAWRNTDDRVAEFVVFGEVASHNLSTHFPLLEHYLHRDSLLLAATLIDRSILTEAVAHLVRLADGETPSPIASALDGPENMIARCLRLLKPGAATAEMNKWFATMMLGLCLRNAGDVGRSARLIGELDRMLPKQCYSRSAFAFASIFSSGRIFEEAYSDIEPRLLAPTAAPGDFARAWLLRTSLHLLGGLPAGVFRRLTTTEAHYHDSYARGLNHPSDLVRCATLNHIRRMSDISRLPVDLMCEIRRLCQTSESPIIRGLCTDLIGQSDRSIVR